MTTRSVRQVSSTELDLILPTLVELLQETVNGGTAMGFLAPLGKVEAIDYWRSVSAAIAARSRILLAAFAEGRTVGCVQLALASAPNARHRAELEKLFVAQASRGQCIGRSLMHAAHASARAYDRRLILLNTRRGSPAEGFYKALGYLEAGVIPGWSIGASGERYDHVRMYRELPA